MFFHENAERRRGRNNLLTLDTLAACARRVNGMKSSFEVRGPPLWKVDPDGLTGCHREQTPNAEEISDKT